MGVQSNADLRCRLNHLIQTCKDGQEGFLTAAENVADPDSKKLFSEYSLQRSKFVGDLQSMAHELGESDPEAEGSVTGTAHRGWMNLKSAILSEDAHAVLVECERGESHAVAQYEKFLQLELPAPIRELASLHYAAILAGHHEVRMLADAGGPKWA
ncbi:MAG: PA2169 family four-helix-bundle protein [Chthoniobacter sp.]|uniref:ferritin-like domain-containing protein n=1 Tax=Chthoniobacter sp. TaxID=2510640 RepID=UPI0032AD9B24